MAFSFSSKPAATTSTFGGFGTPAASTAQPSTGLFGATSTPAPSGGLFGSTSQPAPSTSLFGQPQQPQTSSLFGQPAASAPQAAPSLFGQPSATPSLFGGGTSTAGGAGLFGGGASTASSGGLFGQSQQQQQPAQPTVTAAPLFGQSQSAASSLLFGSTVNKPLGSSLLTSTSQPSQSTSQPVPKLGDPYPPPDPNEQPIESRIEAIKQAWDTNDPKCRFQTYFYNTPTPPNTVSMYTSAPPGANEEAWRKAVRENPDPEHLVPALAVGFPSVQRRIESQIRQSQAHQSRLQEIHAHLAQLAQTHSLSTSLRLLRASQTSLQLSQRLLKLVARSAALSPQRNLSVRKDEEELRVQLEGMGIKGEDLRRRGNELWSGVGTLKSRKEEHGQMEWAVVDEEGMAQILQILSQQQAGLDLLTQTLNKATADVDVINAGFGIGQASPSKARS